MFYLYHRDICLFPDINIYFNMNCSDVYFYLWQRTCLCLQYIQLYKVYLYLRIMCVSNCAISRHVCVAVQHTACACEVSPKSVLAFALSTFANTLRFISLALTYPYIRAGFSVDGNLVFFSVWSRSRRLCTTRFYICPPTVCCCTQQLESALTRRVHCEFFLLLSLCFGVLEVQRQRPCCVLDFIMNVLYFCTGFCHSLHTDITMRAAAA